jgi:AraC-like DNA-binding protein
MGLHPIVDLWPIRDLEAGFCAEVDAAIASLSNTTLPLQVAQHRLKAVLVWMQLHGAWFQSSEDHRFAGLVRSLLSTELELPWTAPLVAKRLGMSEATLRRRLAQEAITLSELIVDVRMSSALTMLHSTDQSIAQISNSVGYESPSRFAARFRSRFGFVPTSIRRNKRNAPEL